MKKLIITMALVSSISLFANTQTDATVEEVIVAPLVVVDDEEEATEEASLALVQVVEEEKGAEEAYVGCGCGKKDDHKA